jgi:hypothetical protein
MSSLYRAAFSVQQAPSIIGYLQFDIGSARNSARDTNRLGRIQANRRKVEPIDRSRVCVFRGAFENPPSKQIDLAGGEWGTAERHTVRLSPCAADELVERASFRITGDDHRTKISAIIEIGPRSGGKTSGDTLRIRAVAGMAVHREDRLDLPVITHRLSDGGDFEDAYSDESPEQ